jgi:hypothetical protein
MAGEMLEEEWTAEEVELVMGAAGDMYVSDGSAGGWWCLELLWIKRMDSIKTFDLFYER